MEDGATNKIPEIITITDPSNPTVNERPTERISLGSRSHSFTSTMLSEDGTSLIAVTAPPSPVLSTQSSALSLRDNKPDGLSSYSSLHLSPSTDKVSIHYRKASNATFRSSHEGRNSFDETEHFHSSGDDNMIPLHHREFPRTSAVA